MKTHRTAPHQSAKGIAIGVSLAAVGLTMPSLVQARYLSGDFHNHTTCSDGSTSVKTLTKQSLTYLDWFIQSGHSGSYSRDCRLDDFAYDGPNDGQGDYWQNTEPGNIKGNNHDTSTSWGCDKQSTGECKEMWRWQSLQEINLPGVRDEGIAANKPAFIGVEWVVPGHEHSSASVIANQFDEVADTTDLNPAALAQWEYCFARPSNDDSQGGGQGWTCEISSAGNDTLKDRFTDDPDQGPQDYNATLDPQTGVNIDDDGDHVKSTAAIHWMQEHYPGQSYAIAAHVERQGAFIPGDDEGYNIEHLRDWNSAAPDISFGFESQPGHQPVRERGSYHAGRPTAGLWTWGGTGCYSAGEAARPGHKFDGSPITRADVLEGGELAFLDDRFGDPAEGIDRVLEKIVLCRPGVRTMWDAMLSEGRKFWTFASSDWHSRGEFAPFDKESTGDFWPGEYQKHYTDVRPRYPDNPAQDIVDGLRSGNSYAVQGDLIDKLRFRACDGSRCATMGGTLKVKAGTDVKISIWARDPESANNSPYSFNNPSLLQIGIEQPLNEPELARVDLIMGEVTGLISPKNADGTLNREYSNPLAPQTTLLAKSWTAEEWQGRGPWKRMSYVIKPTSNKYVRIRGTNIPAGTPNEQDADGNPLADKLSDNILCVDPACPPHVEGILDADVEAWADIWFYANPIFIEVEE